MSSVNEQSLSLCITVWYNYKIMLNIVQVVDPDIPKKGLVVNGEKILAPSVEVLKFRKPHLYLVRFFDGRRSW